MNLLDAYVTEIVGEPRFQYNKYWIMVKYECLGTSGEFDLMFNNEYEALEIEVGHKFFM